MERSSRLHPTNSVIWVTHTGIQTIDAQDVTIDLIGEKAFGLASLPKDWTLPFFVVSDKMFDDYIENPSFKTLISKWSDHVIAAATSCGITPDDPVIVRSNAHSEGLAERGKFISVTGIFHEWPQLVKHCFDDSIKQEDSNNIHMPVIVQKRATALFCGHITNERRVAPEIRDWKGEIETTIPKVFSISLRNWRKK